MNHVPHTDEAMIDQACDTLNAVGSLAEMLKYADAAEAIGKVMSCPEAEALAYVFRAAGHESVAVTVIREHALHDTDMTTDDVREYHGDEAVRCPVCVEHPGWADDTNDKTTCGACFGSGRYLNESA